MDKHIILFLAANPHGTDRLALEREAHAIQAELERSGYRDCFDFVTRWAAEPLDILRELRKLRPTVVHFSGHGGEAASTLRSTCSESQDAVGSIGRQDGELYRGVLVHGANGGAHIVSGAALAETLGATGSSVKLVVLNACYNDPDAEALLTHVGCVVGVAGSVHHEAARSFAIGFYGGLGERESVDVAYKQGCAAISLGGLPDSDRPRLKVRHGVDPKQLVLAPRRHDLAQLVGMASAAGSTACPYPGMRPFEAHQANVFFGRRREVNELLTRIDHGEREIYVIGPSGSGKSSLVQAGLLHALEGGSSRLGRSFIIRSIRPGARPIERLTSALDGDVATPALTIGALLERCPPAEHVLVFVDQLEELFTIADSTERQRFIATIRDLRTVPRCRLLLALRADFYGALMDSKLWPDLGSISRVDVAPLRGPELVQAITQPAIQAGMDLDKQLCEQLVTDAAGEPGVLPLLQETLRQLWDQSRDRRLDLAMYKEIGEGRSGLHIAIARHADAEFGKLTLARQAIARRVLLRLVSFGEGRPDTRRQQEIKALRSAAEDFVEFSCVLQQLINARLVTVGHGAGADDALADLSHEAIITAWPTLQRWIELRRVDEQRRRRLDAKVSEWIERGRGNLSLLDAVELSEAIDWMRSDAAAELGYSSELPTLVEESEVELEKERQLTREVRRLTEKSNLERGHSLLIKKQPMQAIPYLVAARAEMDERPVLRVLFGQAAESLPRVTFIGHESLLTGAAFSPDGKRVVTASCDRTAQIWDTITGEPIGPRLEHQSFVSTAMFSSDGTRIVTASHDHTAQIWDAVSGRAVASPLCHHGIVTSAVFNADGTRVLTASRDKTARIWNASTGELIAALEHEDSVVVATFHPMGTSVVTASCHIAQIWNATNGAPIASPFKHENQVCVATFSPDGSFLLTASHDGITQVWNIATGSPITRPFKHKGPVVAAAFSLDGKRVVTASWDKTARVWDIARGEPVSPSLRHRGAVSVAAFSPDGTRVVTVSGDKTAKGEPGRTSRCLVRVWRASTGKPITPWLQHSAAVSTAVFSPDGTRIATASWDRMARIWNISTNKPSFARLEDQEGDTAVIAAAFSLDGNRVVTASLDRIARVWDVPSGTLITQLIEDRGFIWTVAFSSDGSRVVTATWDMTAWIGDPSTVAPRSSTVEHRLPDALTAIHSIVGDVSTADLDKPTNASVKSTYQIVISGFNSQNSVASTTFSTPKALAGGPVVPTMPLSQNAAKDEPHERTTIHVTCPQSEHIIDTRRWRIVRVWDTVHGNEIIPSNIEEPISFTAICSDGTKRITVHWHPTKQVWCVPIGVPSIAPLEHRGPVFIAAVSPNGERVATAGLDKTARIWDARTGKPVTLPLRHLDVIGSVAFSPDSTLVVTASVDRTARVWDASTGQPLSPPLKHREPVNTAAFSFDNSRVVTASVDGTAQVWDASTGMPLGPLLKHRGGVNAATFSPDGSRVVTASEDHTARVWTFPIDMGSLEEWRLLSRCSPFTLLNEIPTANPEPLRLSPRR